MPNNRFKKAIAVISIFLIIQVYIGLVTGVSSVNTHSIVSLLTGSATSKEYFIVMSIRLPRLIISFLAGSSLAISGALLKTLTKNDLADPGILGINAGAGVAIAILYLFIDVSAKKFAYTLPAVAFIGGVLTAIIIYYVSRDDFYGILTNKLIFAGIGCSMALSGLMIILLTSAEPDKVQFISKWLSGSLWGADWPYIYALAPWIILLVPYLILQSRKLDVMALSNSSAISLGLDIKKSRFVLLMASVALSASSVAVAGSISFIGLIAPHIAKKLVGKKHSYYLVISFFLGGNMLMAADIIGNNIIRPVGVPAGIIVALMGTPYFIYLLVQDSSNG